MKTKRSMPAALALALGAIACGPPETALESDLDPGEGAEPAHDAGQAALADATTMPAPAPERPQRESGAASPAPDAAAEICEAFSILTGRVRPEMLIVLDRSGSMKDLDDGINRWDPSVSGLKTITSMFDNTIDFGLMVFPGLDQGTSGGRNECVTGSVEVPIGVMTSGAIASKLDMMVPLNSTPTAATLAAAHATMAMRGPIVDGKRGEPYIVLVTDGAPNCDERDNRGGDNAVQQTVKEIDSLAKDGIRTYVLGYDTQSDARLKSALDAMAAVGGTGDTAHRPIEDEAGLVAAFQAITASAVTCDYALESAPNKLEYLSVELGGRAIGRDEQDGWSLSSDKLTLSLHGAACDELRTAENAALSVKVQCDVVEVF